MSDERVTIKEYIKQGFDSLHQRLDTIENNNNLIFLKKDDYNMIENRKSETERKNRIDLWVKIISLILGIMTTFSFFFTTWFETKIYTIVEEKIQDSL